MLKQFYPDERAESTYQIPFEAFYQKGIRGVIFDVDNTLVPHDAPADDQARQLFKRLRTMGMESCLASNNKEPRVRQFAWGPVISLRQESRNVRDIGKRWKKWGSDRKRRWW